MAVREECWREIMALFDLHWKDHGLNAAMVLQLEGLGLHRHSVAALATAARLLVKECEFPPRAANWFQVLEGYKKGKEAVWWKDCWGRTMLGDGGPKMKALNDVFEPPKVYALLGRKCPVDPKGLPEIGYDAAEENRKLLSPMQRYISSGGGEEEDFEYLEKEHEPDPSEEIADSSVDDID